MNHYTKFCVIFFFILLLPSCNTSTGASINSQVGATKLTTELDFPLDQEFISQTYNIAIAHPLDWSISSAESMFFVEPDRDTYPPLFPPVFHMSMGTSYTGRSKLRIPQPATKLLTLRVNHVLDIPGAKTLTDVTAVDINGRDGATVLVEHGDRHQYIIVLRISEDEIIVLSAHDLADRSEKMQQILNTLALNIRPLIDD